MKTRSAVLLAMLLVAVCSQAQYGFNPKQGCLNVVNVAYGPKMGAADQLVSVEYRHEYMVNEHFSVGGGIGYGYRFDYKVSVIPLFASATYFPVDNTFSPYINLRLGAFGMAGKQTVDTRKPYSISSSTPAFSLFLSPTVGFKVHVSERVGIMLGASYDAYLLNAYDTNRSAYHNRLVGGLGINLGLCFQIPNW